MYLEPLHVDNCSLVHVCSLHRSAFQLGGPCWLCGSLKCTNRQVTVLLQLLLRGSAEGFSTCCMCCEFSAHPNVFLQLLVTVQCSSLRPIQLPLTCVELATSPSGVSTMVWEKWCLCCGSLGLRLQQQSTHLPSQDTLPSLAPPPIRR